MPKVIDVVSAEKAEQAAKAFNEFAARMVEGMPVSYEDLRSLAKKPVTADEILVFETNVYRNDPAPELSRFRAYVGRGCPLSEWGDGGDHKSYAEAVDGFIAWCDRTMRTREPSPADLGDSLLQR